jgi:hypothetical protein
MLEQAGFHEVALFTGWRSKATRTFPFPFDCDLPNCFCLNDKEGLTFSVFEEFNLPEAFFCLFDGLIGPPKIFTFR